MARNAFFDLENSQLLTRVAHGSIYPGSKEAPLVVPTGQVRLDNPNTTEPQDRKNLILKLKNYNFGISTTKVNLMEMYANEFLSPELDLPATILTRAVIDGMVWATCHHDPAVSSTFAILCGQPICFDLSSGCAVTGINPAWGSDEYRILGTAWKTFVGTSSTTPVYAQIPITLDRVPDKIVKLNRITFRTKSAGSGANSGLVVTLTRSWDGSLKSKEGQDYTIVNELGFSFPSGAYGYADYDYSISKYCIVQVPCSL